MASVSDRKVVHLLDYGAGNVRSIRNAIQRVGYEVVDIRTADDIKAAEVLVFPGVGSFGPAADFLAKDGFAEALKAYIAADKPFLGICLGMQTLFEASEEAPGKPGLGVIKGTVVKFEGDAAKGISVPQIGWNGVNPWQQSPLMETWTAEDESKAAKDTVYFVHSYCAVPSSDNKDWVLSTTDYGGLEYISSVQKGRVCATQFHPEKSGEVGLGIFRAFLSSAFDGSLGSKPLAAAADAASAASALGPARTPTVRTRRVVACLDVRSNDSGDLVVTKGDQYDVREKSDDRGVRNLGKPVELAGRYYDEGCDELCFLNITAFRDSPLTDQPMLAVLEAASEKIFVPMTVGGGIRGYTDSEGKVWSAVQVADRYFRAGADKVSIGSDAVLAAEAHNKAKAEGKPSPSSSISEISAKYGAQAVVISVDPRRVYVEDAAAAPGKTVVKAKRPGPKGEEFCWYQCTIRGGREGRDLCAVAFAGACEEMGAGELLVNCVDEDGQKQGFDHGLLGAICDRVGIPVVGSSGAGKPEHFSAVFEATRCEAALAAGIFHRREVGIDEVKKHLLEAGVPARPPAAKSAAAGGAAAGGAST